MNKDNKKCQTIQIIYISHKMHYMEIHFNYD